MWYKEGKIFNDIKSIRKSMEKTSLPRALSDEFLGTLGFDKIQYDVQPEHTNVQRVVEGPVEERETGVFITWLVEDMFQDILQEDGSTLTKLEQEASFISSLEQK